VAPAAASGWAGDRGLTALCGGEALPRDLADWLVRRPRGSGISTDPQNDNLVRHPRVTTGDGPVSIGHPIANTQIYVWTTGCSPYPSASRANCTSRAGTRPWIPEPSERNAETFVETVRPGGSRCIARAISRAPSRRRAGVSRTGRPSSEDSRLPYRNGRDRSCAQQSSGRAPCRRHRQESDAAGKYLAAYITPRGNNGDTVNDRVESEHVAQWRSVWDVTYEQNAPGGDPQFNIVGWRSSLTGEPIPAHEMLEWVQIPLIAFLPGGRGACSRLAVVRDCCCSASLPTVRSTGPPICSQRRWTTSRSRSANRLGNVQLASLREIAQRSTAVHRCGLF
jgi:polyketide synthase 12